MAGLRWGDVLAGAARRSRPGHPGPQRLVGVFAQQRRRRRTPPGVSVILIGTPAMRTLWRRRDVRVSPDHLPSREMRVGVDVVVSSSRPKGIWPPRWPGAHSWCAARHGRGRAGSLVARRSRWRRRLGGHPGPSTCPHISSHHSSCWAAILTKPSRPANTERQRNGCWLPSGPGPAGPLGVLIHGALAHRQHASTMQISTNCPARCSSHGPPPPAMRTRSSIAGYDVADSGSDLDGGVRVRTGDSHHPAHGLAHHVDAGQSS